MRKRWLLILTGLTAIGCFAFWLHDTGIVLGWLRGEAFFQGRPTHYWSRELAQWNYCCAIFDFDRDGLGLAGGSTVVVDGNDALPDILIANGNGGTAWLDSSSSLHSGYSRAPGMFDKLAGQFGMTFDSPDPPALLLGDPAGKAVLRELLDDPDQQVRAHAKRGLNQIQRGKVE